jgi:hypothetical protein
MVRLAAEALWRDEGCALRNVLRENIRDCYGHAEHCRRRAKEQSDPLLRQDFLDCERRWPLLARGYELAERMEALSKGLPPAKRVKAAA